MPKFIIRIVALLLFPSLMLDTSLASNLMAQEPIVNIAPVVIQRYGTDALNLEPLFNMPLLGRFLSLRTTASTVAKKATNSIASARPQTSSPVFGPSPGLHRGGPHFSSPDDLDRFLIEGRGGESTPDEKQTDDVMITLHPSSLSTIPPPSDAWPIFQPEPLEANLGNDTLLNFMANLPNTLSLANPGLRLLASAMSERTLERKAWQDKLSPIEDRIVSASNRLEEIREHLQNNPEWINDPAVSAILKELAHEHDSWLRLWAKEPNKVQEYGFRFNDEQMINLIRFEYLDLGYLGAGRAFPVNRSLQVHAFHWVLEFTRELRDRHGILVFPFLFWDGKQEEQLRIRCDQRYVAEVRQEWTRYIDRLARSGLMPPKSLKELTSADEDANEHPTDSKSSQSTPDFGPRGPFERGGPLFSHPHDLNKFLLGLRAIQPNTSKMVDDLIVKGFSVRTIASVANVLENQIYAARNGKRVNDNVQQGIENAWQKLRHEPTAFRTLTAEEIRALLKKIEPLDDGALVYETRLGWPRIAEIRRTKGHTYKLGLQEFFNIMAAAERLEKLRALPERLDRAIRKYGEEFIMERGHVSRETLQQLHEKPALVLRHLTERVLDLLDELDPVNSAPHSSRSKSSSRIPVFGPQGPFGSRGPLFSNPDDVDKFNVTPGKAKNKSKPTAQHLERLYGIKIRLGNFENQDSVLQATQEILQMFPPALLRTGVGEIRFGLPLSASLQTRVSKEGLDKLIGAIYDNKIISVLEMDKKAQDIESFKRTLAHEIGHGIAQVMWGNNGWDLTAFGMTVEIWFENFLDNLEVIFSGDENGQLLENERDRYLLGLANKQEFTADLIMHFVLHKEALVKHIAALDKPGNRVVFKVYSNLFHRIDEVFKQYGKNAAPAKLRPLPGDDKTKRMRRGDQEGDDLPLPPAAPDSEGSAPGAGPAAPAAIMEAMKDYRAKAAQFEATTHESPKVLAQSFEDVVAAMRKIGAPLLSLMRVNREAAIEDLMKEFAALNLRFAGAWKDEKVRLATQQNPHGTVVIDDLCILHPNDIAAGLTPDDTLDDRDKLIGAYFTPKIMVAEGESGLMVRPDVIHPAVYPAVVALNALENTKTSLSGPGIIGLHIDQEHFQSRLAQIRSAMGVMPMQLGYNQVGSVDIRLHGQVTLRQAKRYWTEFAERLFAIQTEKSVPGAGSAKPEANDNGGTELHEIHDVFRFGWQVLLPSVALGWLAGYFFGPTTGKWTTVITAVFLALDGPLAAVLGGIFYPWKQLLRGRFTWHVRRLRRSGTSIAPGSRGQWRPILLRRRNQWPPKAQDLLLQFLDGHISLHEAAVRISSELPGRSKKLDQYRLAPFPDIQDILEYETLPECRLAADRYDAFSIDYADKYKRNLNTLPDDMLDRLWDYMREGPTMLDQHGFSRPLHDLYKVLTALRPHLDEKEATSLLVSAKFLPDKTKERRKLRVFLDRFLESQQTEWKKNWRNPLDARDITYELRKTLGERAHAVMRHAVEEIAPSGRHYSPNWYSFEVQVPIRFYYKGGPWSSQTLDPRRSVPERIAVRINFNGIPSVRDILMEITKISALANYEWQLYGNRRRFESLDDMVFPDLKLAIKLVEIPSRPHFRKLWYALLRFGRRAA